MNAAIYDFAAIAKLTKAFADTPPQNVIDPVKPEPESPAYSYSSEDQPVDYGMFAGYDEPSAVAYVPIPLGSVPCQIPVAEGVDWSKARVARYEPYSFYGAFSGRISTDRADPGYAAYVALVEDFGATPIVRLNGLECTDCVLTADPVEGYVVRYKLDDHGPIVSGDEFLTETVYGEVSIQLREKKA